MTSNQAPVGTAPIIIVSHPREPGTFNGTDGLDVEDWLRRYERVSSHNRWDDTLMLANVSYSLRGAAETWFDTNEATITSWDDCKQKLRAIFGQPETNRLAAKNKLATRAQTSTESYVAYIQDVLALCQKVDNQMSEDDKVANVLKGIADDAFHLLVCKDCTSVDAIIKECRRFEQAKSRRIAPQYARLPNTAVTSSCEDLPPRPASAAEVSPTPTASITQVVRRELEAMAPALSNQAPDSGTHMVPLIQAVVRQEIATMGFPTACSANCRNVRPNYTFAEPRTDFGLPRSRTRNLAEWRTADDRPICFNCRRVGHVARYCRSRWLSSRLQPPVDSSSVDARPRRFMNPDSSPYAETSAHASRFSRSPSPQRRQSRSPQPRRFQSPVPGGRTSSEN